MFTGFLNQFSAYYSLFMQHFDYFYKKERQRLNPCLSN